MGQYALNAPRGRERVVDQDLGFGERQQGKKKKINRLPSIFVTLF